MLLDGGCWMLHEGGLQDATTDLATKQYKKLLTPKGVKNWCHTIIRNIKNTVLTASAITTHSCHHPYPTPLTTFIHATTPTPPLSPHSHMPPHHTHCSPTIHPSSHDITHTCTSNNTRHLLFPKSCFSGTRNNSLNYEWYFLYVFDLINFIFNLMDNIEIFNRHLRML